MAVPQGFSIRVTRLIDKPPYPINIHLPPIKDGEKDDRGNPPRLIGPELDVIIPDDEERHTLLGKFLDAWSLLEGMVGFIGHKLIETDTRTMNYIRESMGMRKLLDLLTGLALLKLSEDDARAAINLLERVRKLNGKRNVLVHGHWLLEINVFLKGGHAMIAPKFVRELLPLDPGERARVGNPRNQKDRIKHLFTHKRIAGASKDAATLSADIGEFLQKMTIVPNWKDKPQIVV